MWNICSPGEWHNEGGDVGKLDPDIKIRGTVCGLTSYTNDICDVSVVGGVRSSALVVSYRSCSIWVRRENKNHGCRSQVLQTRHQEVLNERCSTLSWRCSALNEWVCVSSCSHWWCCSSPDQKKNKCTRCMALASKGWALCPWDLWTSLCRWRMVGVIVLFVQGGVRDVWEIIPAQFNHPTFRRL